MAAVNNVRVGVGVLIRDPKHPGKVSIVKYHTSFVSHYFCYNLCFTCQNRQTKTRYLLGYDEIVMVMASLLCQEDISKCTKHGKRWDSECAGFRKNMQNLSPAHRNNIITSYLNVLPMYVPVCSPRGSGGNWFVHPQCTSWPRNKWYYEGSRKALCNNIHDGRMRRWEIACISLQTERYFDVLIIKISQWHSLFLLCWRWCTSTESRASQVSWLGFIQLGWIKPICRE